MKYRIGKSESMNGFNFVSDEKTVTEEEFYSTLNTEIKKLTKSKGKQEEFLTKAKEAFANKKYVVLNNIVFTIKKR